MAKSKQWAKGEQKEKAESVEFLSEKDAAAAEKPYVHVYYKGAICETDKKGHPTPENRSRTELVVEATDGFIPLWDKGMTLRWRFQERSMSVFRDPAAAKGVLRRLLGQAIQLWGDAGAGEIYRS